MQKQRRSQKNGQKHHKGKTEDPLIKIKEFLRSTRESDDFFEVHEDYIHQKIAELEKETLVEFLQFLDQLYQERNEKKKSCEEPKVDQNPPRPPEGQTEHSEGSKLYVTKYGEKYHLEKTCDRLKGHQSF